MDGLGNVRPISMFGTDGFLLEGSFAPNGASQPLAASNRTPPGLAWAVSRTGVGLFTVTLAPELTFPDIPFTTTATPQADTLANWFEALVIGDFVRATRVLTIQCHRGGVAQEVALGGRINWTIMMRNSTSR